MIIEMKFPENREYISNLAFIRALMIKNSIESLNFNYEEKEVVKKEVLDTLKRTWNNMC